MTVKALAGKRQKTQKKKENSKLDHELAAKCEKLIGRRVISMQYPGGSSRDSVRLILKNAAPVFASTRSRRPKADIERLVLKTVYPHGVRVPKLLGTDGKNLLIQQEIPGLRLSQAIHKQDSELILRYLDNALNSLSQIQQAGSQNGLDEKLPALGHTPQWLEELFDRPNIIGRFLNIDAPVADLNQLQELLVLRKPRFVKWDSRPGNAIVKKDETVFWIDWEHSGTRNRLDDMVWLLADEFIPHRPRVEKQLLNKYLPVFADDLSTDEARQYFYCLGTFHLVIRMGLILKYKKDGDWWSYNKCLEGDKAGVTLKNMYRICKRGKRWALKNNATHCLAPWFEKVQISLTN